MYIDICSCNLRHYILVMAELWTWSKCKQIESKSSLLTPTLVLICISEDSQPSLASPPPRLNGWINHSKIVTSNIFTEKTTVVLTVLKMLVMVAVASMIYKEFSSPHPSLFLLLSDNSRGVYFLVFVT